MINQKAWVSTENEKAKEISKLGSVKRREVPAQTKNLRSIWEGLFFMVWHSDKPQYQKTCMEKIAGIMRKLDSIHH